MGKKTVERKKKKKGRPSLLDLQKRGLRLQQQQQHHQYQHEQRDKHRNSFRNPSPSPSPNPLRRSTRRNPNLAGDLDDEVDDDDDSAGNRREKKLKLVLRLPPRSSSRGEGASDEDSDAETPRKKRRINAVESPANDDRAEKHNNSGSKATEAVSGTPLDSGRGTPLPDKKLLIFILDRLQKKDTYGVFSEPVDPTELPDYHEVIEHPMDFSTVRKKLSSGAYASLEQFEKDIFLISSNAMHYNAADTIYFRQARSIQELAKKDFEILRQDSEDNEQETKTVRRGRPPGKKRLGRPPFERVGSDFSSDATLANAGDNSIWSNTTHDLSRKPSDDPGSSDVLTRTLFRNGENYGWPADHKSDKNDDFPGSILKGISRFGKKPFVVDENRRNTYKLSQLLASSCEPSVLTTFDGERKQLMSVGVHLEHAYARSLARFAMNLGPIAWKVASKKIEKALPSGVKFAPGWVGESEAPQLQFPLLSRSPSQQQQPPAQNSSQPKILSNTSAHSFDSKVDKLLEKEDSNYASSEAHSTAAFSASSSMPAVLNSRSSRTAEVAEVVRGVNCGSGFNLLSSGGFRPKPSFQLSQNPTIHSPLNGFNSGYPFNLSSQVGKVGIGLARPGGNFGPEASTSSNVTNMAPRNNNNIVHPVPTNRSKADAKLGTSINPTVDPGPDNQTSSEAGPESQTSWRGRSDSVPPDLNVRFQSPGSPTSGVTQPDLALQL